MQMHQDMQRMPFFEAMQALVGKNVAIQTHMNVKQGTLVAAFPDLLILEVCQVPFYFRTEEVSWVMPFTT